MADWLLVETLGSEPVVVANDREPKDLVPIRVFLRRSPQLAAIQTAIGETVTSGKSLSSITPKGNRVIRTEPIQMSDGKVHGVHVWLGPVDAEPPERPLPGTLIWDLTTGVATDTEQSLRNSGLNPNLEVTHGRAFAEDLPSRDLNPRETRVLPIAVAAGPGATYCNTWDATDQDGNPIKVVFVVRTALEAAEGGPTHLIARAMNWRADPAEPAVGPTDSAVGVDRTGPGNGMRGSERDGDDHVEAIDVAVQERR
jgi:Family of unknown function (DUF5628)/Domain of unknown function (DUF5593)